MFWRLSFRIHFPSVRRPPTISLLEPPALLPHLLDASGQWECLHCLNWGNNSLQTLWFFCPLCHRFLTLGAKSTWSQVWVSGNYGHFAHVWERGILCLCLYLNYCWRIRGGRKGGGRGGRRGRNRGEVRTGACSHM